MAKIPLYFKKRYSKKNIQKFFSNGLWTYKEMFRIAPFDTLSILVSTILNSLVPIVTVYLAALTTDELVRLVTHKIAFTSLSWNSHIIILALLTALTYLAQEIVS